MIPMNMLPLLSLSQLEHKARTEDNTLALTIIEKIEQEVQEAVETALDGGNDADYSYKVYDAINAVQFLLAAEWSKVEETKQTRDVIIYRPQGLHEDTSPYNNHIELSKYKGSDVWRLKVCAGQYGEDVASLKFNAAGFKDAQKQAVQDTISLIGKGTELNV